MRNKGLMKLASLALATTSIAGSALAVGCGKSGGPGKQNTKPVDDGKTVNVRIYSGGYGTTYIDAVKEKFEETFKDEGYKINVLPPDPDLGNTNFLNDLYSKTGVDVYFCGCEVEMAATGYGGQYGNESLVMDITESVINKNPIKFDGTEETVTVGSKIADFDEDTKYNGKYYNIPYVLGTGGLAVNTRLLNSLDLEIPKTTDELFACADAIMDKYKGGNIAPFTFSASGNNYPIQMVQGWMMQYLGLEDYRKFLSMEESEDVKLAEPASVFGKEGTVYRAAIEETLTAVYEAFDARVTAKGAAQQDFTTAQSQLMSGTAAFFVVGDWMLNEEFERFTNKLNDVTFVNMPVISALGTKLFGSGTTYNKDDSTCENILKSIIDMVDENKEIAEIKTAMDAKFALNFATADIERVCEARGALADRSGSAVWINKDTKVADIATLFLRYLASTDCGSLIAKNTRTNNPFAREALNDSEYPWIQSVNKLFTNKYAKRVKTDRIYGYRKSLALSAFSPYTGNFVHNKVREDKVTIYDFNDNRELVRMYDKAIYSEKAKAMADEIYKDAKNRYDTDWSKR